MYLYVMSVCVLDFVDAGSRQGRFVQVIKVRVSHGLACRDPLGRIVGQHFLQERADSVTQDILCVTTRGDYLFYIHKRT